MNNNIYTAGLIDGEGTITLSRYSAVNRAPVVSVSSTSIELIKFLKKNYRGTIVKHKIYKTQHNQAWSWRAVYNNALSLLEKITPYLKEVKKRKRALYILNNYKKVTTRSGKYTEIMKNRKEEFEREFFKL